MALITHSRTQWIEQFVKSAADSSDAIDVEYAQILGGQMYSALKQMDPQVVAAALVANRGASIGGLLKTPGDDSTIFGDL